MLQRMVLQEMDTSSSTTGYGDEDSSAGFIEMEVTSTTSSPRFRYSSPAPSPIQSKEFEFQMISNDVTNNNNSTTCCCCPADELFYKGKLLPLHHFPPRLKLVEKLTFHDENAATINPNATKMSLKIDGNAQVQQDQFRNHLFGFATAPCTNSNTPMDISPSESCRASTELNPDEYIFDWSTEFTSLVAKDTQPQPHHLRLKNSWSRKIKHSSLGKKLKASRTYLKSLFNKSVCSTEPRRKSISNADEDQPPAGGGGGCVLKAKEWVNKYIKVASNKKRPFGSLQHENFNISSFLVKNSDKMVEDGQTRKSCSGAINWRNAHATVKSKCSTTTLNTSGSSSSNSSSSSSSFSFNFNGFYEQNLLKRSSSANSDLDRSVEGAIAHCRQSQKMQCS